MVPAVQVQVRCVHLGQGAESSENQRRGGPLVEDGRLVGQTERERGQTLEVAEQDVPLLGVQEQGTGLIMHPQLGVLPEQRRQVALQQAVVERQPQPRSAATDFRAHEADLLQLCDDITGDLTERAWGDGQDTLPCINHIRDLTSISQCAPWS